MQYNKRSLWPSIMPVTKHLLVINFIMWLATIVLQRMGVLDLVYLLGLWNGPFFKPYQLLTYMFMHDPSYIWHVFCNMFSLWMFGSLLELELGSKRFLFYYITCGLGAALVQMLVWFLVGPDIAVTVGASGAVFGILLAFGMLFPNMRLYILPFPFPIKAKWAVLGYGLFELFFGISGGMSHVAHFAHLGGMLTGIILILYWKHNGTISRGWNGYN